MSATDRIHAFMHAAGVRFDSHDSDIARVLSRTLKHSHASAPALPAANVPACSSLTELLTGSGDSVAGRYVHDEELMQLLTVCAPDLHWRPAGFGKLPQPIRQKIAVVELLGPSGMYFHKDVRCGLLIQRAAVQYPRHWHAAEELYLVIKGTADWALGENAPVPCAPGAFVHHQSLQPHGMTTRAEAMLALWGWTGEIDGASYSL